VSGTASVPGLSNTVYPIPSCSVWLPSCLPFLQHGGWGCCVQAGAFSSTKEVFTALPQLSARMPILSSVVGWEENSSQQTKSVQMCPALTFQSRFLHLLLCFRLEPLSPAAWVLGPWRDGSRTGHGLTSPHHIPQRMLGRIPGALGSTYLCRAAGVSLCKSLIPFSWSSLLLHGELVCNSLSMHVHPFHQHGERQIKSLQQSVLS